MRRLASLVAIFVLLATAAPVLACVPGALRIGSPRSCCHTMRSHCNDTSISAAPQTDGASCCVVRLSSTNPAHPAAADTSAIAPAAVSAPALFLPPAPALAASRLPQSYLPPGLLSARSTVLRI